MIKAVFFDAINTLFLPNPSHAEMYQRVLFEVTGIKADFEKVEAILLECGASIEEKALKHNGEKHVFWDDYPIMIAKKLGCAEDTCISIGEKIRYETWGNPKNYMIPDDTIPTLKKLTEKGIRIACVSNEDGWLTNFFDYFEIRDYFDFILASEDVGIEKPSPKIFEIALGQAELRPDEVLFVGDSPISDYLGSKNAGMKPLIIDRDNKITDDSMVKITNFSEILEYI